MSLLQSNEPLPDKDRHELVRNIADFLINKKKDTRSRVVHDTAAMLCDQYKNAFKKSIDGSTWDQGQTTLTQSILNRIYFLKMSQRSSGSSEATMNNRLPLNKKRPANQRDEYGCVNYAPTIPEDETPETQEDKRVLLLKQFESMERDIGLINSLMEKTFATQRALLNSPERNLVEITLDWPFLKDYDCLINHCSILIGKDIETLWNDFVQKKLECIRQYFNVNRNCFKSSSDYNLIMDEYREALKNARDKLPKSLVVFKLICLYFKEDFSELCKVIKSESTDEDVIKSVNSSQPTLVIRGADFFDPEAICTVLIEKSIFIFCNDVFCGVLAVFLPYYAFGLAYNPKLMKTLEFFQRFALDINPANPNPKCGKKPRKQADSAVFKLSKAVSDFILNTAED